MFHALYFSIFYQPLFNLLIWLYAVIPGNDMGVAIIILTIIVKLILLPFSAQMLRSQRALQAIQPKIDALKKEHGNDKEKTAKALMELYKKEKVNPLSSCLPLVIQIPFLIAVYQVFARGLTNTDTASILYGFVPHPEMIAVTMFGILDLAHPNAVLAVLAGLGQFFQARMLSTKQPPVQTSGSKDESITAMMNKQMLYVMPVLTVVISFTLPSGLALYWCVTTLLAIAQQKYIFRGLRRPTTMIEKTS